jgi:hypothetical protein
MIEPPQIEYFRSIYKLRLERTESSVHAEDAALQSSKPEAVGHNDSHIGTFTIFLSFLTPENEVTNVKKESRMK